VTLPKTGLSTIWTFSPLGVLIRFGIMLTIKDIYIFFTLFLCCNKYDNFVQFIAKKIESQKLVGLKFSWKVKKENDQWALKN
jgi:hypothetical protein